MVGYRDGCIIEKGSRASAHDNVKTINWYSTSCLLMGLHTSEAFCEALKGEQDTWTHLSRQPRLRNSELRCLYTAQEGIQIRVQRSKLLIIQFN